MHVTKGEGAEMDVAESDVTPEFRQEAIRSVTRDVVKKLGPRYWLRILKEEREPTELLQELAHADLLGVGLPESLGGSGGGILEEAIFIEELGRGGLPQGVVIVPNFARRMVSKWGTPEQAERFVAPSLTGESRTSFGLTEADSGTNAFGIRTKAEPRDGGWLVNGEKVYITNAGKSDQMLLVARTGTTPKGTAELSLFVVDLPNSAVMTTPMNIRASLPDIQYIVAFNDLWLPDEAVVGTVGAGAKTMFSALNPERILVAAGTIGLGFNALRKASDYVRERAPFGRPTGSYQGVQHPLARAYMQLEGARAVTYEAAAAEDADGDAGMLSNTAKFLASEAGHAAIDAAVQVCGGFAFDWDADIMWMYEHIRLRRVAPVNNEMVMNFVAERALNLPKSY
jgi:acyl-CoA dehydrogenase